MVRLDPGRFAAATGLLLVLATALLALGAERVLRGQGPLGYGLLAAGVAATVAAFSLRIEGAPGRTTLLLLTREGCLLCDEAEAILRHVQADTDLALWVADVDEHPQLAARYGDQLPVVLLEGEEVASLSVSEAEIREALASRRPAA